MYPDVLVACGELPAKAARLDSPIIVVEVLSECTAERDHGRKRWAYQTIDSLQHYVLIDQYSPVIEVASRDDDGSWRSVLHRGLEGRVRLEALGSRSASRKCSPGSPSGPLSGRRAGANRSR